MRLKGRVALITGGNSGIGLATAKLFVAEGARVAIGRNQKTLEAAALELGSETFAMRVDVTDRQAMEKSIVETVKRFGNLDVVFANAGMRPMRLRKPVCGRLRVRWRQIFRRVVSG